MIGFHTAQKCVDYLPDKYFLSYTNAENDCCLHPFTYSSLSHSLGLIIHIPANLSLNIFGFLRHLQKSFIIKVTRRFMYEF